MIEQLYEDFTNKFLPKIQDGLVISKDFFTDLFGRYVKYLLVSDIVTALICLIIIIFLLIFFKKNKEEIKAKLSGNDFEIIFAVLSIIALIICTIIFIVQIFDIIKDVFIPEIRVLEILKIKFNSK